MSTFPATREAIREAIREKYADRNRAVVEAAPWFAYGHLSKGADFGIAVSSPYDVSELTHALRRLLEAKDCLVRAAIAAKDDRP